jgi:predicted Zn-dependent protease
MLDKLTRIAMAVVLVVVTANPMVAAEQKKPKNSDIDNIGNRNINKGLGNLNFTSLEKEIALGRQLAAEVERQVRLVKDPVVNEFVNRVGQNIVRNSDAQVPFTFKVIEDDSINAFALPGGFVFVNTGIILTADEEAELAGVMAHEIAHVTARHGTENQTKGQIVNLASIPLIFLGGVAGFGIRQAAGFAIPMQFMKFSRGAEEEADYLGMQYLYKTGYDPGAAVTFFEKVQARETAKPGTMSSLFASHPPTEDRIKKTNRNISVVLPEKDQYVLTTSEFQDVQQMLIAYENRRPMDEEEDTGPSLRRRTARPQPEDAEGDDEVVTESPEGEDEDDRPKLKRTAPGAAPTVVTGETKTVEPEEEPEMEEDPDRPRLKRRRGPPGGF